MSENKEVYYIYDIESGIPIKVTKEERDKHLAAWEATKPRVNTNQSTGRVIIVGTPDPVSPEEFKKLWLQHIQNTPWQIVEHQVWKKDLSGEPVFNTGMLENRIKTIHAQNEVDRINNCGCCSDDSQYLYNPESPKRESNH